MLLLVKNLHARNVLQLLLIVLLSYCLLQWYSAQVRERGRAQEVAQPSYSDEHQHTDSIRVCKVAERTGHIENYCREHASDSQYVQSAPVHELREILDEAMIVDEVNKVLVCLHAKVACSTWKWTLLNNTMHQPLRDKDRIRNVHDAIWDYNISRVGNKKYSDKDIQYRLDNYYKIMVVRHPYDRLQSLYKEKFSGPDAMFRISPILLKKYNPEREDPDKPSFADMVQYIADGHKNVHWQGPYHEFCAPCAVHYDYIVKLETHARDTDYVINNKLQGRGSSTLVVNKAQEHTSASSMVRGKELSLLSNLTASQADFLHTRLQPDLDMFGYTFDAHTLMGKCQYAGDNECC